LILANTVIAGTGSYLPKRVLTNFDLEKIVETSDEWIKTRTGIHERRLVEDGVATSDLAINAARAALENAGLAPDELELIIVATVTPDRLFPATACMIQYQLGAKNAVAFDLNAACSGFIYCLKTAEQYIKAGSCKNILIIGAEAISKIVDWTDRNTCVLFGDGAGAAVIQASNDNCRGIVDTQLHVDGSLTDVLAMPAGGSKLPASRQTVDDKLHYIKMKGNELFKIAVRNMAESAQDILECNGLTVKDVDLFIPHQANIRIINAVANAISLPEDRICYTIKKYGNTSAASIPIALDEAARSGRLKRGDLVLLSAFGSGLAWAASLIRW
jgi:3-oxoacyl-[acyl-carrier-protein] synthase-3